VKNRFRLHQALAVAALAALAACSAAQSVSPGVDAGSRLRVGASPVVSRHVAKFTAGYSGRISQNGDCSNSKTLTYQGSGHAKFLRSSSELISLTWNCGTGGVTGSATLTSTKHRGDSITASLSTTHVTNPCYMKHLSFTITGGSGRFRNATGNGTLAFIEGSSYCFYYEYADKWHGTLSF
jgi:hypothetical protein